MEILKILVAYVAWFITLLLLDYVWLWFVVKNFTIREFWSLITVENWAIKINLAAGVLAWVIIAIMVVTFVTLKYNSYKEILIYWALLWFLSYAMYDLTNYAFINNYSLKFTIIDIAWWTFACMVVALSSYYFYNLVK